jgi:hypothetical protein
MAVHAFLVVGAAEQQDNPPSVPTPEPPSIPSVMPDRVDDALSSVSRVLSGGDRDKHNSPDPEAFDVEHVRHIRRVDSSADKAAVLDALENKVVDLKWYDIRYHRCSNDEQGDCPDWTVERSYGSVPSGV